MNPFFYILVLFGLVILFFALNGLFRPIGAYIKSLVKETKAKIEPDETEKQSNNKNEEENHNE